MPDNPRLTHASETVVGVLLDLAEIQERLKFLPAAEAESAARILDRLSEELAEAAADVRGDPVTTRVNGAAAEPAAAVTVACAEVNAVLDAICRITDPRERYHAAGRLERELAAACKSLTDALARDGAR